MRKIQILEYSFQYYTPPLGISYHIGPRTIKTRIQGGLPPTTIALYICPYCVIYANLYLVFADRLINFASPPSVLRAEPPRILPLRLRHYISNTVGTWLIRVSIFCITFRIKQFPHLLLSTEMHVCVPQCVHKRVASNVEPRFPSLHFTRAWFTNSLCVWTIQIRWTPYWLISVVKSLHVQFAICHRLFLKWFVWFSRNSNITNTDPQITCTHKSKVLLSQAP